MELSFNPSCPVLSFRPRAHVHPGPRNERAWILWPCWIYRVVAPIVKEGGKALNVFEEAVLGMLCAGNCTLREIAELLGLDAELVSHIARSDLVEKRLLDDTTLEPTQFGRECINKGLANSVEKTVGFIFQDPWTERLWSAFKKDLPYMSIDYSPQGWPDLLLGGSKGRPWRQRTHCLMPPYGNPTPPKAEEILHAASAARRSQRRENSSLYVDDDELMQNMDDQLKAFSEVSFVNSKPEPHFLMTYLYTPHDGSSDCAWYACDPFGMGHNMSFKREIEDRAREDNRLGEYVSRFLPVDDERSEPVLGYERAESMVRDTMGPVAVPDNILSELRAFQLKLLQIEDAKSSHRPSYQLIRETFTQARRIMEVLSRDINDEYHDPTIYEIPLLKTPSKNRSSRWDQTERFNRKSAEIVGFDTEGLQRSKIIQTGATRLLACLQGRAKGALTGELMLAVVTASRQENHPFKAVASQSPEFLCDVEKLLNLVHPAAHAGQIEDTKLKDVRMLTFKIARLILTNSNLQEDNYGQE